MEIFIFTIILYILAKKLTNTFSKIFISFSILFYLISYIFFQNLPKINQIINNISWGFLIISIIIIIINAFKNIKSIILKVLYSISLILIVLELIFTINRIISLELS